MGQVTQRKGIIYRKTGDRDVIREKPGARREPLGLLFFLMDERSFTSVKSVIIFRFPFRLLQVVQQKEF